MLTQSYLQSILNYDPTTGIWRWNKTNRVAGCLGKHKYRRIKIEGKCYLSSRLAFLYMEGEFPENMVDHINRDTIDDRWQNLRKATNQENQRNRNVTHNNISGVVGVSWDNEKQKWHSRIQVGKKTHHLGFFDKLSDAIVKRQESEQRLFSKSGDCARLKP